MVCGVFNGLFIKKFIKSLIILGIGIPPELNPCMTSFYFL